MKPNKLLWLITPTLYAIFPVLFLYAQNMHEMKSGDMFWPLIFVTLATVILTVAMRLIFRNRIKIGLLMTVWIILFFSYGHFANLFGKNPDAAWGIISRADRILLPLGLVLALAAGAIIWRIKKDLTTPVKMLAILGVVLVLMQVVRIVASIGPRATDSGKYDYADLSAPRGEPARDIYYIILDGYGRQDVLKEIYNYDNSAFVNFLRSKGFFVADSAHSNYGQTLETATSVLNMDYIQHLGRFDPKSDDRKPLYDRFVHNQVAGALKNAGYKTVAYETGYSLTELKQADDYIVSEWTSSEFGNILLATTPLPRLLGRVFSPYGIHRRRILKTLDALATRTPGDGPEFVFAHVIAPHPPFVFKADGGEVDPERTFFMGDGSHYIDAGGSVEDYIDGYRNQVQFINSRVTGIVDHLLEYPEAKQPIIVIMGDHGPGSQLSWVGSSTTNLKERFSILYAMYLPDYHGDQLSDKASPVNTFRTIFNGYFKTDMPLLDAKSYYATWSEPYDFQCINKDSSDQIHEYLLGVYQAMSPNQVEYRHVSHPKRQGTQCDSEDCFSFDKKGLTVKLHKILESKYVEYSIDDNDTYMMYFRLDSTIVGTGEIDRHIIPGGGLRVDRGRVPDEAVRRGYNNILIVPIAGDGKYALGHILFANGIK